jgi:deferrochelatase/peroxidase EfeB
MTALPDKRDEADVQRLIVLGYNLQRCRHFVLQVTEAALAREFIDTLVKRRLITNASIDSKNVQSLNDYGYCPANIGFTFRGLERLELRLPYLQVFQEKAQAFAEGAYLRAAQRLADTGASAPQWWEACFRPERAHVLLSVCADEEDELKRYAKELRKIPGAGGLDGWDAAIDGCHLSADRKKRTVHFGFRDGISNPVIEGFPPDKPKNVSKTPKPHAAGEFLLGYDNDSGFNRWLLIDPGPAPNPLLALLTDKDREFFRNGSFAAFRKIEQDERKFADFIDEAAKRRSATQTEYEEQRAYLRAKLVGRWDDGEAVKPDTPETPKGRNPRFDEKKINDFTFADDPKGEGCPFGAHIRRMNPRTDPVVPFRRRPLARRGMPYGPIYGKNHEGDETKRGLLGLFFCASLEDQFEHLLTEWANANPMGPNNRGNAKDPLIGNHQDPRAVFDIPGQHAKPLPPLKNFRPFVTTRGTLYAFYPGLKALATIAGIKPPPQGGD